MADAMNSIWIIDDELTLLDAQEVIVPQGSHVVVTQPEGDDFERVLESRNWDLILVDEQLWENDRVKRPPHAVDGSSLVWCIRAWARRENQKLPPIVILTSNEGVFRLETPDIGAWLPLSQTFVRSEASISRALGVEWILRKHDPDLIKKIGDLAQSYRNACTTFGDDGIGIDELNAFLGVLPTWTWQRLAEGAVRGAEPPVTEDQSEASAAHRGPVVALSWLSWGVLPFPGLFVSNLQAAAYLGVTEVALDHALEAEAEWSPRLIEAVYTGPLSTLLTRRWWAPALDKLVADAGDLASLWARLGVAIDGRLEILDPVVVLNAELQENEIVPLHDTVRINPRDWPGSLQPRMLPEVAKSHRWLWAMVNPIDRRGLGD